MKEIGSEFYYSVKDIVNKGDFCLVEHLKLEKNKTLYLNSGRSCIKYLLKHFIENNKKGKILLPSFLCESMLQPFMELNFEYEFYNISRKLEIDLVSLKGLVDSDTIGILFVNYFGFFQNGETLRFINDIRDNGVVIIEDATQSLFSGKYYGDYVIASLRKWFGLPDGGILINRGVEDVFKLNPKFSYDNFTTLRLIGHLIKNEYINNNINTKEVMLNSFNNGEEYLDNAIEIKSMSPISKTLLSGYDYSLIKFKRQENYKVLFESLCDTDEIEILFKMNDDEICPLGFPVICKDRDGLRRYLTGIGIYCPVHWPVPGEVDNTMFYEAYSLEDSIMTIPCDQRYDKEDMKYIAKNIKQYYKGM